MKKFIITNETLSKKIKVLSEEQEDYLVLENGDFVFKAGTLFHNENDIKVNLRKVYLDLDNMLNFGNNKLYGTYFIAIKKGQHYYFFTDDYSNYKVYYKIDNGIVNIANLIYDVALRSKNVTLDIYNLIENSFQYSILNEETIFEDINLLKGDEILKLDSDLKNVEIIKKKKVEVDRTKTFSELLKERAELVVKNYSKIAINMTGGLDSRLVLATYLSLGVKPILIYGIGNSSITNTYKKDFEVVEKISKKYNLELRIMNWKENELSFEDNWNKLLAELGEYSIVYGGNINILDSYKKLINDGIDYFEFGYFGELYRNLDWLEEEKVEYLDSDFLVKKMSYKNYSKILYLSDKFNQKFKNKINKIIYSVSGNNKIKKDDFIKINLLYRLSADTKMVNYTNLFSNSSSLLGNEKIINKLLTTSVEKKNKSKLMIEIINNLESTLLEVPIFSHCEEKKFNFEKKEIESVKKRSKLLKLFDKIKSLNNKIILKRKITKKIYLLEKELNLNILKSIDGDIRAYIYYYFDLFLIKKLSENGVIINIEKEKEWIKK